MLVVFHTKFKHFFFNDTATTEIYTLSLHDALPISLGTSELLDAFEALGEVGWTEPEDFREALAARSEEHTSELQSPCNLVCRLLLEKKKITSVRLTALNTSYFSPILRLFRLFNMQL